jgi:hypothetical protein
MAEKEQLEQAIAALVHVGINKHTVRQQVPYLYMSI